MTDQPTPHQGVAATKALPGAWLMLTLLFLVSTFNYLDRFVISVLLPSIKADLRLNDTELGIIAAAFTWSYILVGIPLARWADTRSRKQIVTLSLSFWSLMTAACGFAQNFVQMAIGRIMVGVGEAGATPPSHSMISDMFPAAQRSRALSIFTLGAPAGLIGSYLLGSWLIETYNWRVAFIVLGVLGLILGAACMVLLKEPVRGGAEAKPSVQADQAPPGFGEAISTLLSSPSFRHLSIATGLFSTVSLGVLNWLPSYFIRSFDMSLGQVGLWLALSLGSAQIIGLMASGILTDILIKRSTRWFGMVPAFAMVVSTPMFIAAFVTNFAPLSALALGGAFLFGTLQGPATFAALQAIAPLRMRAIAVAVFLLIVNLIGGTIGPMIIGWFSDIFAAQHGEDSLKWALALTAVLFGFWSAVHYYLAAGMIEKELDTSITEAQPA